MSAPEKDKPPENKSNRKVLGKWGEFDIVQFEPQTTELSYSQYRAACISAAELKAASELSN